MQLHFTAARGEGGAHRLSRQPRLEACRAPFAKPGHKARLDAARQRGAREDDDHRVTARWRRGGQGPPGERQENTLPAAAT